MQTPLRNVGTPPNTAQSPSATSTLQRARICLATCSPVELLTQPSRMPTSTPLAGGCFKSVIGVACSETCSSSVTSRSSMSSSDMWQPAHPASQSLATVALFFIQNPSSIPTGLNHSPQRSEERATLGSHSTMPFNPERVASTPHISFVKFNFISPQQFPK